MAIPPCRARRNAAAPGRTARRRRGDATFRERVDCAKPRRHGKRQSRGATFFASREILLAISSKTKAGAAVLATVCVLALAGYLVFRLGNPQWHPSIYAYQASLSEDGVAHPSAAYSGIWNNWDRTGRLLSSYIYKDGKRDGPYVVHNAEGGIASEGVYREGRLEGLQKIFQENGSRTEISYRNGQRDGLEKTWFPGGQLAVEAPWVDGKQDGVVTFYFENGSVQASIPFYRGKIEGVQKVWRSDGTRESEEMHQNNLKNGISEFWRPDGTRDMTLMYRDDQMDGVQTWFHFNGRKAREVTLSRGTPHGSWKEWDENGDLTVDEEYDFGELKKKEAEKEPEKEAKKEPETQVEKQAEKQPPTGTAQATPAEPGK